MNRKSGDLVRFNGVSEGRLGTPYENTTWDLENAHKKGLVLDLKSEEGREILFKLLETTDIFITNWRPQAIAKLGLGLRKPEGQVPQTRLRLIHRLRRGRTLTRTSPGYDFTAYWARSGLQGTSYQKGTEPINLIPGIGDHTTGMFLAASIMVALYNAKATGKGDKCEINLLHSAIWTQAINIQAAQYQDLGTKYADKPQGR